MNAEDEMREKAAQICEHRYNMLLKMTQAYGDAAKHVNDIMQSIRSLPAEGTGWISVKERLPDNVREVEILIPAADSYVRLLGYYTQEEDWFDDNDDPAEGVELWRECTPLPSPPAKPESQTAPNLPSVPDWQCAYCGEWKGQHRKDCKRPKSQGGVR